LRLENAYRMSCRRNTGYFLQGITEGLVEASVVIVGNDEVFASAPRCEDLMIEVSTRRPGDGMPVGSQLNSINGQSDRDEFADLLAAWASPVSRGAVACSPPWPGLVWRNMADGKAEAQRAGLQTEWCGGNDPR
jgi:hypothetical protein